MRKAIWGLALLLLFAAPGWAQVVMPDGPPRGIACAYNTTPPTVVNGQAVWAQCDAQGRLIVSGGGGGAGGGSVTQGTSPWVDNITQWASTALGAPTAYGTAPSGNAPGVNAFVTNNVAVSWTGQTVGITGTVQVAGTTNANLYVGGAANTSANPAFVTLGSGTAVAGKFAIDQTTPGTTNGIVINNTPTVNLNPQGAGSTIGSFALNATSFANGVTTTSRLASSANSTNLTLAKSGATRAYKITAYNTTASPIRIKFYNAASTGAVTVGTTTPVATRVLMPNGYSSFDWNSIGFSFSNGLVYALTTGAADNDATAPAAGAVTDLEVDYQ